MLSPARNVIVPPSVLVTLAAMVRSSRVTLLVLLDASKVMFPEKVMLLPIVSGLVACMRPPPPFGF